MRCCALVLPFLGWDRLVASRRGAPPYTPEAFAVPRACVGSDGAVLHYIQVPDPCVLLHV